MLIFVMASLMGANLKRAFPSSIIEELGVLWKKQRSKTSHLAQAMSVVMYAMCRNSGMVIRNG